MYDYDIVFPSLFCLSVINNFLEELFIMIPITNTLNGTHVTTLFSYLKETFIMTSSMCIFSLNCLLSKLSISDMVDTYHE